jgi:hypothetical protein
VTDVARIFAISAGHVSRLADDSKFVTNGLSGQERRVDALSVIQWFLTRPERQDGTTDTGD